jgi:DNA anti-recombination protein RmuC
MFHQQEISALARIEMEVNIARAQAAGRVTVEMEAELKGLRKQEAHWQAEFKRDKALQDLELEKVQTLHDLDQDKKQTKVDQAMAMFEQVQKKKADRIGQMQDHQNQRMDNQNDAQIKMMEMAKEAGALTPDVMQEFLKQQTAQKAIDGDGTEGGSRYSSSPAPHSQPPPPVNNCCGLVVQPGWKTCPKCGKNFA